MKYINDGISDVETWEEARFLARLDYELHRGQEIDIGWYVVHDDVYHNTQDVAGETRAVLSDRSGNCLEVDLRNSCDEYLDPYWDLEIDQSELPEGTGGPWTHGPSYRILESSSDRMEGISA